MFDKLETFVLICVVVSLVLLCIAAFYPVRRRSCRKRDCWCKAVLFAALVCFLSSNARVEAHGDARVNIQNARWNSFWLPDDRHGQFYFMSSQEALSQLHTRYRAIHYIVIWPYIPENRKSDIRLEPSRKSPWDWLKQLLRSLGI